MTNESNGDRLPPRERFAGTEHVFDLHAIARGLRHEDNPVRDGHRQMTIFHKHPLTLVLFDFEPGGGLAHHQADAHVTILALSGQLEIATPAGKHVLPEGSLLVLDPGVVHDVLAPVASQMLLTVDRME